MNPTLGVLLALLAAPARAIEAPIRPGLKAPSASVPLAPAAPAPGLAAAQAAPGAPAQSTPQVPAAASAEFVRAAGAAGAQDGALAASAEAFDGKGRRPSPDFDPQRSERAERWAPQEPRDGADEEGLGDNRPQLSFPPAARNSLTSADPARLIYGAVKRIREEAKNNGSEVWWSSYKRGVEIDVVSNKQNVFGRPTRITYAATKPIGRLTRDDLRGVMSAYQLQLPVKELRQSIINRLEEERQFFRKDDAPVTLATRVRLVKFQSFLDLYRQQHGQGAVPAPTQPAQRAPLVVKPEGRLEPFKRLLPRAVFLDLDMLKAPLTKEALADIAELQRTGVQFVAFSRKPFDSPGSVADVMIRNMATTQQMSYRFLAVTDDGAVISEFRKDGAVVPIDVSAFASQEVDVLRDAAQKAFEETGIAPRAVGERRQPPIFIASRSFNPFQDKAKSGPRAEPGDPRVRFELLFPRETQGGTLDAWISAFDRRLKEQGLEVEARVSPLPDGRASFTVQKTSLGKLLDRFGKEGDRLGEALGDKFGVYLNGGDIAVLSDDADLKRLNPRLDLAKLTRLDGAALVENMLGLMLGKARDGGNKLSASRMIQFSGYRDRYMSEFLHQQDASEQNINFFSGHVVHSANDWLIARLQKGERPTPQQYEAHLRARWQAGIREDKPVRIPSRQRMERLLGASVRRGLGMYEHIVGARDRGEVFVGTEIPNFVVIEDYKRGVNGKLKKRHIVHTIFDFIALRPTPGQPGHATLVIYDFKTGPVKSREKLEKDDQVLTYSLFAYERWVGERFPVPYLSGSRGYVIDDAVVEYVYGAKVQKPQVHNDGRQRQWHRIIRVSNRIQATEEKLLGVTAAGKPSAQRRK